MRTRISDVIRGSLNQLCKTNFFASALGGAKPQHRRRLGKQLPNYQALENRKLLAVLVVDTIADDGNLSDGLVSLREAITATNTNTAFGDAAAGDQSGDVIRFADALNGQTIALNGSELSVTDDLVVNGGGNITLSGSGQSRIFNFNSDQTFRVNGLTFTDGSEDTFSGSSNQGGAILAQGGGILVISSSSFTNNVAQKGGAIFSADSRIRIGNSSFSGNEGLREGGALAIAGGQANVLRTNFSENRSRDGAGVHVDGGSFFSDDSTFTSNRSIGSGGAIYLRDAFSILQASTVTKNQADVGAGIFVGSNADLSVVSGTVISENAIGGGIFNSGKLYVLNSAIRGNRGVFVGGGIHSQGGEITIRNSEISENRKDRVVVNFGTTEGGGGIFSDGTDLTIVNTVFQSNRAGKANNYGGAIFFVGRSNTPADITIRNSTFEDNFADKGGGALYVRDANVIVNGSTFENNRNNVTVSNRTSDGGAISIDNSQGRIGNSTFTANRSMSGGALCILRSTLEVFNSEFTGNIAEFSGGAISNGSGSQLTLVRTDVGTATGDPNLANSGGGISLQIDQESLSSSLTVIGGSIQNNIASTTGGGIAGRLITSDPNFPIEHVINFRTFTPSEESSRNDPGTNDAVHTITFHAAAGQSTLILNNRAGQGDGGGINAALVQLDIRSAIFESNTARSGAGLYAEEVDLTIAATTFGANVARVDGGGILLRDTVFADLPELANIFESNVARDGDDIFEILS